MRTLSVLLFLPFLLLADEKFDLATYRLRTLKEAILDLQDTFSDEYSESGKYLKKINKLEKMLKRGKNIDAKLEELRQTALLANPLLDVDGVLFVQRKTVDISRYVKTENGVQQMIGWGGKVMEAEKAMGLPSNHECNSSLKKTGYDNAIIKLDRIHPDAKMTTIYTPPDSGYVGEVDLHWNADKMLVTQSDSISWKIWQMNIDGSELRQVSKTPDDVDCGDACFMPNSRIVFGSTASMQSVPCWHGQRRVSNLYSMRADGSGMRQLCFDQDHDFHPTMLANGQVLYNRWDYTGISHIYFRQLMVMNPDGTGQRAIYGSNSWFPNALYFPKALPGSSSKFVAILAGYHGAHRMGQLVVVDTQRGYFNEDGLITRISGCGQKIEPKIRDNLVDNDWPKFLHPYPLSDKYFLVSAWLEPTGSWGLYLADVFDNLLLIKELPGYAVLEPTPIQKRDEPRFIPNRVNLNKQDATVYLHDVYAGPGLNGVPRDVVKSLRIFSYDFGYLGMAGPHKIGIGGPWEATRILGTVPLEEDGSVMFTVPANTPIAFQALDGDGKTVQLMRSWVTAMPGETVSCIGCHESPADVAPTRYAQAALKRPKKIQQWYGSARGFDFEREVQPVLNTHCVSCHNASHKIDLRREDEHPDYDGSYPSSLGFKRMHPVMKDATGGKVKYTPAYEALLPYTRRVSIEDDVEMLIPGELHVDTSPLFQMLRRGHHDVQLDNESWDRLTTWIDLNAPCHGTWNDVFPVQDNMCERRQELRAQYGGPPFDPEEIPELELPKLNVTPAKAGSPLDLIPHLQKDFCRRGNDLNPKIFNEKQIIHLCDSVSLTMVKIQDKPTVWMSETEITNEQYNVFDPLHDSRYYNKRHIRNDDQGIFLNEKYQPVVRVSKERADDFCEWLSEKCGDRIALPTFDHWRKAESGMRRATKNENSGFSYATIANLADTSFSYGLQKNGLQISGGVEHLHLEGAKLADLTINDGHIVTAAVKSYEPNAFGLYDVLGNAAEWTRDEFDGRAVAVGGSFFDHPDRIHPIDYPAWQRVFNVGFRIVMEGE